MECAAATAAAAAHNPRSEAGPSPACHRVICIDAQIIFSKGRACAINGAHKKGRLSGAHVLAGSGIEAVHAKRSAARGVRAALPELRLQVVDRNFAFRECNYSLYPSWLAYPWANAHLLLRGTRPYSLDRCERTAQRSEASAPGSMLDASTSYNEGLDAGAVSAALSGFAASAPRPAKVLLNLNTGPRTRRVTGQLNVLGCRIASVSKSGELSTLGGLESDPALGTEPGGPARTDGLRVRHRILIRPGTRVYFVLPQVLADAARKRPRPGQRIERIEVLPSVFTDSSTFRSLWPDGPQPLLGARFRLDFRNDGDGLAIDLSPVPAEEPGLAGETAEPLLETDPTA